MRVIFGIVLTFETSAQLSEIIFSKISTLDVIKESMDKIFFKMQDRLVDFNVTAYEKFSDMASDSTLQLNLRNYYLLNFSVVSKKKIVSTII